ncbi:MAG: toll/interleukin-1 receptor domain-containing protein [Thermoanaerobaculia bacterium]
MSSKRDTVLISHANPEDNVFTEWLAFQLMQLGYKVWCDLLKLLGGEDFWRDIEEVIRRDAAKVVFVASKSCTKDGSMQELALAKKVAKQEMLRDFVIPAHIGDIPYSQLPIELTRLNAVPFEGGWLDGLRRLVQKLQEENVPAVSPPPSQKISEWWEALKRGESGLSSRPESLSSNWYCLTCLPKIWIYRIPGGSDRNRATANVRSPVSWKDLELCLEPRLKTDELVAEGLESRAFLEGREGPAHLPNSSRHWLLRSACRRAWEEYFAERLGTHSMSSGKIVQFFKYGFALRNRVVVPVEAGSRTRFRTLAGLSKTRSRDGLIRRRYWHLGLGVDFSFEGVPHLELRLHILFSDDGARPWSDSERMHRARRRFCRMWRNDRWRDLGQAAIAWLANGADDVSVAGHGDLSRFRVSAKSMMFLCPVSSEVESLEGTEPEEPLDELDDDD